MSETVKLLPCPFCGSTNIDPDGWASTERSGPACDDCSGSADTVEMWNSRPISQAGAGGGAVVRALEWRNEYGYPARASTSIGIYEVTEYKGMPQPFKLEGIGNSPIYFFTLDKAKASAQADYEARVLDALAPSPSAGEPEGDRCLWTDKPCTCGGADCEQVDFGADATPPATPVQPTASVEAVVDQASRLMAAGWRGNPNMSGDDRDFMTPSMRRRHDDKVRQVVELVIASLTPAPTQGDGGDLVAWIESLPREPTPALRAAFAKYKDVIGEPAPSPASVSAPSPAGGVREGEEQRIRDWLLKRHADHLSASADNRMMMRREFGDAEMFLDTAILLSELSRAAALSNPAPGHGEAE